MKQILLTTTIFVFLTGAVLAQTVTSISPLLNTRDISVTSNITISFSEAMDDATVTSSTVIVSGSQRGVYSGSFSYGATSATFDPDEPFFAGEIITVIVTEGVQNEASNAPITAPYRTMFTAEASGDAEFQESVDYTVDGTSFTEYSITADIDEDGDIDIVTLTPSQNKLSIFVNDGDGAYTGPTNYTTLNGWQVEAKDVDQDGSVDLVTSNNNAFMLSVFMNDGSGSGTFTTRDDYANGSSWNGKALTTGDIDNDGDEDVLIDIIIGGAVDSIQVFLNDGDGTFTVTDGISTTGGFEQLKMADIDGDEDLDLIGVSPELGQLWSWKNDGTGSFSANTNSTVTTSSIQFALANFNGNGPIDAITTDQADDEISVVTEDNSFLYAFWETPVSQSVGDGPTAIAAGDIDGDGDIDVVLSNANDQNFSILINNGSASFTETNYSTSGTYANYISLADVDGDGDVDIVAGNQDGTLSIIKNYPGGSVSSITPAHGALDITTSSDIAIKFDEGMSSGTLDATTVLVMGSLTGLHDGSYTYTAGDSTLTINPTDDFAAGEAVTVVVTTGVENPLGTPLSSGSSTNFVVASGDGEIFGASNEYTAGNEPTAVAMADVNGDGDIDIIIANTSADSIAVLIGAGDGTFASPVNYYAGDAPSGVASGDVDNDGDLDLVVTTNGDDVLSRFLNNGDGTFAARSTFATTSGPGSISLGDIDNDGDLDAYYSANNIMYTQSNNGSGAFSSESVWGTNSTVVAPPVDLNGDGLADYVGVNGNSLRFVLNDGDGTYTYGSSSLSGFGSVAGGVVTGDFDGDGDIDIVSSYKVNSLDGYISFSANNGSGGYAGAVSYTLSGNSNDNPGGLSALDVDGDGDLDIAVVNTDFDEVVVFLNDGSGIFTNDASYTTGDTPEQIAVADVNGDGIMDVVIVNSVDDNVSVLLGGEALEISSISPTEHELDIAADSDIDIVFNQGIASGTVTTSTITATGSVSGPISGAVSYNGGTNTATLNPTSDFIAGEIITVFVTTGIETSIGSTLDVPYQYSFTVGSTTGEIFGSFVAYELIGSSYDVKFADMDNDGDADIVTIENIEVPVVGVYLNNGSGSYTLSDTTKISNDRNGNKLAIADFDQDGYLDAALSTKGSSVFNIEVFINDQAGSFNTPTAYVYSTDYAAGIDAADINLDGYPDIVATRFNGDAVHVLFNDGDGTFTAQTAVTVGGGPYLSTKLIDVDSDNDLDLVTSDWDDNTISVAKNNGDGTFASHTSFNMTGSGVYTGVIESGDLDGDGDLDLVVSQTDDDDDAVEGLTIFINNGSGDYSSTSSIATTANALALLDMEGDGDLDIITANGGVVSIYHNNGSGTFTASPYSLSLGSLYIRSMAVADVDGDGDVDLSAVASDDLYIIKNGDLVNVSSTSPSANGLDVSPSSNITVTFNSSMDVATFQDTSVIVTGSKSGVLGRGLSLSNPTLTIDPTNNFLPGEIVTVLLTNDLKSSGGTALYSSYSFSFTVEASGNGNMVYRDSVGLTNSVWSLKSADIDNDGDEDLIGFTNSIIDVYEYDSGSFSFLAQSTMPSGGFEKLYFADIDSDGDMDITVHPTVGTNQFRFLENNGSGSFTIIDTLIVSSAPDDVVFQDFDNDGNLDLAYIYGAQITIINWGLGDFNFSGTNNFGGGSGYPTPKILTSGDVDNDGDMDIVLIGGDKVVIGINQGSRSFNDESTYEVAADPEDVELADFDGDGYLDIVVASEEGSAFTVFINDGDGTFGAAEEYSIAPYQADRVSTFDYDGDGDLDLAMHISDDDEGTEHMMFAYNSSGAFANQLLFEYPTADPYYYDGADKSFTLIDADGDGDLDLASLVGNSSIAFAENAVGSSSSPTTAASSVTTSAITSSSAKISWTNGDGARRLVVVKEGSAVNATPVDNTGYNPNPAFESGTQLGSGNYAVYGGASNSVIVTGLDSETDYHVQIFEMNGIPGSEKFYTSSAPTGSFTTAAPPTVWSKNDATVSFTKNASADPKLEANQDRITDYVWFTRAAKRGLFNAFDESFYDNDDYSSPSGTQWALGTTDDIGSLSFDSFYNTLDGSIGDNIVGEDMVVYVEDENLYFDIKFSEWGEDNGGSFSYTRSDGSAPTPLTQSFQSSPGYAVQFDDGDNYEQYFEIITSDGEYPVFGHRFSTEMWVKPDTLGEEQVFLELYGPEIVMGINSSNQFYAYHTQSSSEGSTITITGTSTVSKDQWYHVALTGESGESLKLYVNGVEVASSSIADVSEDQDYGNYWYLGADYDGDYPFYGTIDEFRIWKTVRTPSEIRSYMHRPYEGPISPLAAYFQFTEGSGDTYDSLNEIKGEAYDDNDATWVTSTIPFGNGTVDESTAFQTGTATIGNAALTMADGFDNPVDVQVTEVSSDPNVFPSGYTSGIGGKYFVINLFGTPGTFSANLTLTFGSGVITATQESHPDLLKLYHRSTNSTGAWTEIASASSANASTGVVTWNGITSFSQFMSVADEYVPPTFDIQISDGADVISYNDSTYEFASSFFDFNDDFADSVLTINSKSTLSGSLYLDQNSNGAYDVGTDSLLTAGKEVEYTPSGSIKLRYSSSSAGEETATIKMQLGSSADSVSLDFYTVDGDPTISGNAGENGWYLLSNPFTTTVGELLDNIWTQGAPNSDAPGGDATLFTFSQDSSKYVAISTDLDTTKLAAGTGLLAYIFADDDNNAGTPLVNNGWPKTLTNYGTPFGSDVDISIKNVDHDGLSGTSGSEGFALLGNPYGWPLSADSVIATIKREDALANSYVYRWNPVEKQYQLVTTGAIEAYESFFVRIVTSGATANLSFDYDDADIATPLKQVANNPFELTLVHSESGLKSHSYLRFDEKASESIDPYDGYYLGSYARSYANLYTQVEDQRLTINNIPTGLNQDVEYPMYLDATLSGEYDLVWNNEMLPKDFKFTLKEVSTGIEIDLSAQSSYSFNDGVKAKTIAAKDTISQTIETELENEEIRDSEIVSSGLETDGEVLLTGSLLVKTVTESKTKTNAKASGSGALFVLKVSPLVTTGSENEDGLGIPTSVELEQNYPNPFNPTSMIQFGVPKTAKVQLEVFDILGRKIMTLVNNETKQPGRYNVQFEARNLATGMYIYRLVIGDKILTKKMLLIK